MILLRGSGDNRLGMAMRWIFCIILLATTAFAAGQTLPATAPSTKPITGSADSPRQAYERLVVAMQEGDGVMIRQLIDAQGADQRLLVEAMSDYAQALATLRRAAVRTYGAAQARVLTGDPADLEKRLETIRQAQETIEGEQATLNLNMPDTPLILLRRAAGQWRVTLSAMLPDLDPTRIAQQIQEMALQVQAFDETTADILADKFHTADEAAQILRSRLIRPAAEPTTAATH